MAWLGWLERVLVRSSGLFQFGGGGLVVLRFLGLRADDTQGFFEEPGSLLTLRAFETVTFYVDVSSWGHFDSDGGFHTVWRTSLMEPFC